MRRFLPAILAVVALAMLATGAPQSLVPRAPTVALPVTPPVVVGGEEVPAWRFVGPRVAGVPCGEVDYAALLREGRFGWRVLVVDAAGIVTPDGRVITGTADERLDAVRDVVLEWNALDTPYAKACGGRAVQEVLLAVDASTTWGGLLEFTWIAPNVTYRALVVDAGHPSPSRLTVHDAVLTVRLASPHYVSGRRTLLQTFETIQ